ncbi:DUF4190 domain-containing protein [Streptomyces abyssomicinicus]|uniref:DUF4190 domain-containing protein n=1 Tax=Streptomyces abyssomicinicus TaxID=574929 RepID=UPI00125023A9|nr:DUF4190 domain-containing protein [Streptomyces abyssomicinicus]
MADNTADNPYAGGTPDPWAKPAESAPQQPGAVPPPPASAPSPFGPPPQAPQGFGPVVPPQVTPQWAGMPPQPSNGMGVTSMVLGIVGVVFLCFWPLAILLGVLAIIFGAVGIQKAKRGEATNRGMAMAGLICGICAIVLPIVLVVIIGASLGPMAAL